MEILKKGFIYGLYSDGEPFYVGSTCDVDERKRLHISDAFRYGSCNKQKDETARNAVNKNSFELRIIESFTDVTKLGLLYLEAVEIDRQLTLGIDLTNHDFTGPRLCLIDRDNGEIITTGRCNIVWEFNSDLTNKALRKIKQYTGQGNRRYWLIPEEDVLLNGVDYYSKPIIEFYLKKTGELTGRGRTTNQIIKSTGLSRGTVYNYITGRRTSTYNIKENTNA